MGTLTLFYQCYDLESPSHVVSVYEYVKSAQGFST